MSTPPALTRVPPVTRSTRALTGFWLFAGLMHFVIPRRYESIVPDYVPISPKDAVVWSGVAEIVGGLAVAPPPTRRFARWWLLGVLVAVFPANVHMAVSPEQVQGLERSGIPRWALWARLPLQPLCMLWVWRATE
ncbi:MAG: hypothetical protein QOJ01_331 [Solirubrobacterales bacterium]|nr:hypothetical protein [Solirubrobacterales bacterium]